MDGGVRDFCIMKLAWLARSDRRQAVLVSPAGGIAGTPRLALALGQPPEGRKGTERPALHSDNDR